MTKNKEAEDHKPPKERVHITIDKALVGWMDSQIKTRTFHNRSHTIEKALQELMKNHSESKT